MFIPVWLLVLGGWWFFRHQVKSATWACSKCRVPHENAGWAWCLNCTEPKERPTAEWLRLKNKIEIEAFLLGVYATVLFVGYLTHVIWK